MPGICGSCGTSGRMGRSLRTFTGPESRGRLISHPERA
jgi:hypothetical protein